MTWVPVWVQVLLTFGFTDESDVPRTLQWTLAGDPAVGLPDAVYVLCRGTIAPSAEVAGRRLWRERLFAVLHRNAVSAVDYVWLPRDRLIELGAIIEI